MNKINTSWWLAGWERKYSAIHKEENNWRAAKICSRYLSVIEQSINGANRKD